MAVEITTSRLAIRPLASDELREALEVYLSQLEYVALVEGSAGEPGHYEIDMLERDWAVAQITPGRVMAGIRLVETGGLVGLLDWIDPNPDDGLPWIGLILVAAAYTHCGYAREAVEGLLLDTGWPVVREGVIASNRAGLGLAHALGFERYGETEKLLAGGPTTIVLFERRQ